MGTKKKEYDFSKQNILSSKILNKRILATGLEEEFDSEGGRYYRVLWVRGPLRNHPLISYKVRLRDHLPSIVT